MQIYEYKARGDSHCDFCGDKFEVRQGINDEPLTRCPECGAEVSRVFSGAFMYLKAALSSEETFAADTEGEGGALGLDEDFDEDEAWE